MAKKKSGEHYVKNSEFYEEMKKSLEQGSLTKEAVEMMVKIATHSTMRLVYQNEEDRKDCISGAILGCMKQWNKFNPEVSDNPFAFFTQVCKNEFARTWRELGLVGMPVSKRIRLEYDTTLHL